MQQFLIGGEQSLRGAIQISGAKNAALPILAATLLTEAPVVLKNLPHVGDITTTLHLLENLGVKIYKKVDKIELDPRSVYHYRAPYELVRTMRASILVSGPLLARYGQAVVSLPGGCAIGARPVNMHIQGLKAMGADIEIKEGYIHAQVKNRLKGTHFIFEKTTVNGTQNLIMAAVLAEGETFLENAAQEPEVVNLADFLNQMGARIQGAGTHRIFIQGVHGLKGGEFEIMPDRIEAGTYLIGAALTQGDITLKGMDPHYLESLLLKLKEAGAQINLIDKKTIRLIMQDRPQAVDMVTAPYPGFPTDLQAQFMTLNTVASGQAKITETIFENRFMHVQELVRLGADIKLNGRTAIVNGVSALKGAPVMATDLRASVSLVLAGLAAKGKTTVDRIYHIDRGYENIDQKLSHLGIKIERIG